MCLTMSEDTLDLIELKTQIGGERNFVLMDDVIYYK